MHIVQTQRLRLRELNTGDAAFILELVNEPAWLRFIGDRGIKTADSARDYIRNGPMAMYARLGFGLWLVERLDHRTPIGICGLLKRDTLEDMDLGFAFLSAHWGNGYAFEAASATLAHAKSTLGATRIVAVVSPGNESSVRLLEKLGFSFERTVRLSENAPEIMLYGTTV